MAQFNPNDKITKLRGSDYLEAKWRLVWFREEHPDWTIETVPVVPDIDKQVAVFQATIKNAEGRVIAQATKMETVKGFADWLEKAETGSVGRALALCGYGTQFAPEFDEGDRPVDAPVPGKPQAAKPATLGGNGKPVPPQEEDGQLAHWRHEFVGLCKQHGITEAAAIKEALFARVPKGIADALKAGKRKPKASDYQAAYQAWVDSLTADAPEPEASA